MSKKIIVGLIVAVMAVALCGCGYFQQQPQWEQYEEPHEEPHEQRQEEHHEEPHEQWQEEHHEQPDEKPQEIPPEEPKTGIGQQMNVEGTVKSVNDDIVKIITQEGESFILRLSEETNWAPDVEDWNIEKHKYIAATVIVETPGQGKVIYITFNGFAG